MKYISTRGEAPELAFDDVLLAGLANDGGLYVPAEWPQFGADELSAMAGLSYAEIAFRVVRPFVGGTIADADLQRMIADTYAGFGHSAVAPLKQIGDNDWLMELFHGPTLAFKDYALQFVGRMFDHVLERRGDRVTIVGATSGDTGSAAIEACRDRDNIDVFILFPEGRVSPVQQRQMTTVGSANVHAIAVKGTFDDCQDLVKAAFNDAQFRMAHNLSAVNSINWARVLVQVVYYFAAAVRLGAPLRPVSFAVPTGNFGNVLAGWVAWKCGLPVERLVVGTNRNDILFRFFETGEMAMEAVEPSLSPSMDIQVSSNFERLLFDMYGGDGRAVRQWLDDFRTHRTVRVDDARLADARKMFHAARLDDEGTRRVIREVFERTGELLDPHSAIGVDAARQQRGDARRGFGDHLKDRALDAGRPHGLDARCAAVIVVIALHDDGIALAPLDQLEGAGAVFLRRDAFRPDRLDEVLGHDLLERQHRRKQGPGLGQGQAHGVAVDDFHPGERAEKALARAGLAVAHAALDRQPVERELDVLGRHRRAVVESDAIADLELVNGRRNLRVGFRELRMDVHVGRTREQPVIHVADDGLGLAVAVVRRVECVGVACKAHHQFLRAGGRYGGAERENRGDDHARCTSHWLNAPMVGHRLFRFLAGPAHCPDTARA